MRKRLVATLSMILLTYSPALLRAAELQVTDSDVGSTQSPVTMAPCATAAASAAALGPGMTIVSSANAQAAAANGMSPDCDEAGTATAHVRATVLVAPTGGDSIGEPVILCVSFAEAVSVNAMGAASASAAVGGVSAETEPALVQVLRPGVSAPVVAVPPNILRTAAGPSGSSLACQSEFTALIGDSILFAIGGNAIARISGVGNSGAASADSLALAIGACMGDLPRCPRQFGLAAPMASTPAMTAMAALLAILGWFGIRRRGAGASS